MLDFLLISTRSPKKGVIEIYPKFIAKRSSDLMIRGSDFYAIWDEENGIWSTDEQTAIDLIDAELDKYAKENSSSFDGRVKVLHLWDVENRMIDGWHRYCKQQLRDRYHMLDEKLIFSNAPVKKTDYASKRLSYPLVETSIEGYDKLMSTLYSEDERHKIEWAIGAVVSGDSKKIQKFLVLYGSAGTGKSTVLNIIQQLFDGYYSVFDAKALGSSGHEFALEAFKSNPLVAIQHDGDLSKIEDNTRLNSLVSHEQMTVNEKFKSTYTNSFKCFLFMGTNKPVKITDAKSGLIRRLIDVSPSGNKLEAKEYRRIVDQIPFELGGIATHCRDVYLDNPNYYDDYIPVSMMSASNDFYNFILDAYYIFEEENSTTLKAAWEMYKQYCEDARVPYPYSQKSFKEELKNYFYIYKDRHQYEDGIRVRNYYSDFKHDIFEQKVTQKKSKKNENLIEFKYTESYFDVIAESYKAQYAGINDIPITSWDKCNTTLSQLDTRKLHYVRVPLNHIVIDFDIQNETGEKSFERNLIEASKWPKTYAELSKSGKGIHLHYIYEGDPELLSRIYAENIEIKVFTGNSSLRRKFTFSNGEKIATIASGLPLKGAKKMVNLEGLKDEQHLRALIAKCLKKEYGATKPSIDFIKKLLDEAYESGMKYDVTNLRNKILAFAAGSTHQSEYCIKLVNNMKFASEEMVPSVDANCKDEPIIFYDVEVFPNLFLICWKFQGKDKKVVRMYNPTPQQIEEFLDHKLVGFNCRRYDNHMLYACLMGYNNQQLFDLSSKLVNADKKDRSKNAFFGNAYNLSYTDVYDFSSLKQSLKKFEIDLGIHHQELGLPWNEPVPEKLWDKVGQYCEYDVLATEATFDAREADFIARQILAELAGMSVNDTTNSLSTKIIFGSNKHPQAAFRYRNMGEFNNPASESIPPWLECDWQYTVFNKDGTPVFPGYSYEMGVSTYRGEEVGEGGYVYAEPGMYTDVALLDIASMHPSSIIAEELFGPEYTQRFKEILDARLALKHRDFDTVKKLLNGVLVKYLKDDATIEALTYAIKIVINSVYGLTSAKFENPFRDPRNIDNIVAKRGALFMVNLKHEVQNKGFTVAHIKTDSIKIPNATPEIIQFVVDYGKLYGYNFEHEATYDRMTLVNNAVYIAKYASVEHCENLYGDAYVNSSKDICKENKKHPLSWTATGTQFQVPYVFKTLFSKEPIEFKDLCETKSVKSAIYLDINEGLPDGEHDYIFVGKIGQFCPIVPGHGGGTLVREAELKGVKKYDSITGTKGYKWLESETVKELGLEKFIDISYYDNLVTEAIDAISKYGDYEWFNQ